ncbi:alpha/beta fold hydrolase [Streptomyces bambusae]|uniref:thioesterase II family protein n=1 Tax=Streptomyces bambusae TaxID=1550616 RepID=UPI001CFCC1AD|nr:alpha/beta fold hydrolase [Streptomyces bambusae]MCB5165686.1 alpha/beta fold hydrolase [Streptomyces bambusae]
MTWLQCTTPRPDAERRLVCFPHEGGVASFFARWAEALPGTEVHAACYPGRAERAAEPCATDVRHLAGDLARAVRPLADRPLVLFGHSLGAWIAFETARELEAAGSRVCALVVSGAPAPQTRRTPGTAPGLAGGEFAPAPADSPAPLLAEPVLLKLVFPYVQADARMAESYVHRPGPPLNCPVTTLVGAGDPTVTAEDATAWADLSQGAHQAPVPAGPHRPLAARPPQELVRRLLDGAAGGPERSGPLHRR